MNDINLQTQERERRNLRPTDLHQSTIATSAKGSSGILLNNILFHFNRSITFIKIQICNFRVSRHLISYSRPPKQHKLMIWNGCFRISVLVLLTINILLVHRNEMNFSPLVRCSVIVFHFRNGMKKCIRRFTRVCRAVCVSYCVISIWFISCEISYGRNAACKIWYSILLLVPDFIARHCHSATVIVLFVTATVLHTSHTDRCSSSARNQAKGAQLHTTYCLLYKERSQK